MMKDTRALRWIVGDDTGMSSKAIWAHMMGAGEPLDGWSHPHDPADFGRCAHLLIIMPEWRRRLPEMRFNSVAWELLVEHWDEIEQCMESEVGLNWEYGQSAPLTFNLMQSLLET